MSDDGPARISTMCLERDGTMSVTLTNGRTVTETLRGNAFEPTSAIASSTYYPKSSQLRLRTIHGDDVRVDLSHPVDPAPLSDRRTIYLDQNHWSTLTNTIHDPDRVANEHNNVRQRRI